MKNELIAALNKGIRINGKKYTRRQIEWALLQDGIPWQNQLIQILSVFDFAPDYNYQRYPTNGHVAEIRDDFDPLLMQVFRVCKRRNGRKSNVDQNHQREAIVQKLERGEKVSEFVLAMVQEGTTVREEARIFQGLNTSKKVGGNSKFKAGLAQRKQPYVRIKEIAEKHGFTLAILAPGNDGNKQPNAIRSVYLLPKVWDKYNQQFENAFKVLRGAWARKGIVPHKFLTCEVIQAIAMMLATQAGSDSELSLTTIIKRLKVINLHTLMDDAARAAANDGKTSGYARVPYLAKALCTTLSISTTDFRKAA